MRINNTNNKTDLGKSFNPSSIFFFQMNIILNQRSLCRFYILSLGLSGLGQERSICPSWPPANPGRMALTDTAETFPGKTLQAKAQGWKILYRHLFLKHTADELPGWPEPDSPLLTISRTLGSAANHYYIFFPLGRMHLRQEL